MADEQEPRRPIYRRSTQIQPGQPIKVSEPVAAGDAAPLSSLGRAMQNAFRAYMKAGRDLLVGEHQSVREWAPPQFRIPCHTYIICCPDGVLVRHDAAGEEEPKVRAADKQD